MQAARKHIQKAAQKHIKGHQRQPSLDFSVLSSEDGRAVCFRKDLDTISQDSRNGEMTSLVQGPAAKAAVHKGAMSEPVRRAHRVKIHEPPETRRGIFSRMSSADSHHTGASPCIKVDVSDLDTSSQTGPVPDTPNPIEVNVENKSNESTVLQCAVQEAGQTFEAQQPEECDELSEEPQLDTDVATESDKLPETQTDSLPQPVPHPHLYFEAKSPPPMPPSSPARLRRTMEAPAYPLPSTRIQTKVRSHSCPRKQTTSAETPMMHHKFALHWQMQRLQLHGSYSRQVRPIPNGMYLSDSTSSSSDVSTDSQVFVPPGGPDEAEQYEGTLQREMKALFDQKMREIRCKSPLFLNGESCVNQICKVKTAGTKTE